MLKKQMACPTKDRLALRSVYQGRSQRGFTLFEVAISLGIVSFGVVSVLMLLPSGIKAQQFARFQILASARAVELIDAFASVGGGNQSVDREGPYPWDVSTSYRAYAPDMEIATGTHRYGLMPLPVEIAKRLDSEGDEIQQILGKGGYIYYSNPMATSSINNIATFKNLPLPNETGKIICAVNGYAQQNAIPCLSYKDWPYYAPYPSPPMHVQVRSDGHGNLKTSLPQAPYSVVATEVLAVVPPTMQVFMPGHFLMLWENTLEADEGEIGLVFRSVVKGSASDLPNTTKWVAACELGGVLEKAKNNWNQFYFRNSGYLACCDMYGWIPEPALKQRNPPLTPPWDWYQNSPDTSKINDLSRLTTATDFPGQDNGLTADMISLKQPPLLTDFATGATFPNPVAGVDSKVLAKESALAYFALALWYAQEKGVSASIKDGLPLLDDDNLLSPETLYGNAGSTNPKALAVNAARILAHAAMVVSGHMDAASSDTFSLGQCDILCEGNYPFTATFANTSNGVPAVPTTRPTLTKITHSSITDDKTPAFNNLNLATMKIYVDNAMKLGMRFAATYPYDWGSPRPLNRAVMMDNPLIQYDMFNTQRISPSSVITPFTGYNYGVRPTSTRYGYAATKPPAQWRVATAQPIVNLGRNQTYPSMNLTSMWPSIATNQGPGNADASGIQNHEHFTLARPFQPVERTRELVFWAVDWQSYEDFETAPSAPVDASRYPKTAPAELSISASDFGKLSGNAAMPDQQKGRSIFWERSQPATRNPEKVLTYIQPTTTIANDYDLMYVVGVDQNLPDSNNLRPDHPNYSGLDIVPGGPPVPPITSNTHAMVFSGQYGADRNANGNKTMSEGNGWIKGFYGKLDRGPLPRSVRMRATLIARFNFYDPRLPLVVR